jgi:hypothetical protein
VLIGDSFAGALASAANPPISRHASATNASRPPDIRSVRAALYVDREDARTGEDDGAVMLLMAAPLAGCMEEDQKAQVETTPPAQPADPAPTPVNNPPEISGTPAASVQAGTGLLIHADREPRRQ